MKKIIIISSVVLSVLLLVVLFLGVFGLIQKDVIYNEWGIGKKPVIVAKIIEDISSATSTEITHYVVRFYQEDQPISTYIALPTYLVVKNVSGQMAVPILAETLALDNIQYIAPVIEVDEYLDNAIDQKHPPFVGSQIWTGLPCIYYFDSYNVQVCNKSNFLSLKVWGYDDPSLSPTWEEIEQWGPSLNLSIVDSPEFYLQRHKKIDQNNLSTKNDFRFGLQSTVAAPTE